MTKTLTLLGIESSCDETAAAVVRGDAIGPGQILSNEVFAQESLHIPYGGVVPELAARAHAEKIDHVVEDALSAAAMPLTDLDAIAVTAGPGLIGGVLSGVMTAKALSAAKGLPLIGVNHLAGHALTPRLTEGLAYPYLMLLVSGGHCQFLTVHGPDHYSRLGGTIDDAPGEAFDKSARLLGLGYPGGPAMERAAERGDPTRFALPRPLLDREGCDMSFSGLKTALRRQRDLLMTDNTLKAQDQADLAASFQMAVADVLAEKTSRALSQMGNAPRLAVAGGVAANKTIRAALQKVADAKGATLSTPPLALCTDNAAMIAWAGLEQFAAGARDDMTLSARPRWPLDQSAAPLLGSGKKGAKA